MRGDSRRDLYAKALALCGLGVLVGVGAVVDYWPVAIRFPAADSAVGDRIPAPPPVPGDAWARVDTVTLLDTSGGAGDAMPRPARRRQHPPGTAMATAPEPAPAILPVALAVSRDVALFEVVAPVRTLEAPPPAALPLVVVGRTPRPTDMVARLEAPAPQDEQDESEVGERLAADGRDSDRGMFGTAIRVTGRSIARSGAATGASVADAFRVVGGLFRRALPD